MLITRPLPSSLLHLCQNSFIRKCSPVYTFIFIQIKVIFIQKVYTSNRGTRSTRKLPIWMWKIWMWRFYVYLYLPNILISRLMQIPPYPSQATLEQKMQDQANWDSFRTQTINSLLDTLHLWHIITCYMKCYIN